MCVQPALKTNNHGGSNLRFCPPAFASTVLPCISQPPELPQTGFCLLSSRELLCFSWIKAYLVCHVWEIIQGRGRSGLVMDVAMRFPILTNYSCLPMPINYCLIYFFPLGFGVVYSWSCLQSGASYCVKTSIKFYSMSFNQCFCLIYSVISGYTLILVLISHILSYSRLHSSAVFTCMFGSKLEVWLLILISFRKLFFFLFPSIVLKLVIVPNLILPL